MSQDYQVTTNRVEFPKPNFYPLEAKDLPSEYSMIIAMEASVRMGLIPKNFVMRAFYPFKVRAR